MLCKRYGGAGRRRGRRGAGWWRASRRRADARGPRFPGAALSGRILPMTPGPRPNFRTIALIVGAAVFMEQMDATILATALPGMARDLGVSAPSLSIALTSYLISLAIFIPASGWLADRLGGRVLFRGAILFFTAASAL